MRLSALFVLFVFSASAATAAEPVTATLDAAGPSAAETAAPAAPAVTIERNDGVPFGLTVYNPDGSAIATLRPDGTVDVRSGTPEEAARAFFRVLTDVLVNRCSKP
jgi:hypothetical protein